MIPVRSLAEAAVYARATGAAPFERASLGPNEELWRCWWRDERRDLHFRVTPSAGPSTLLDADAFLEVGQALLRGIPTVLPELPRSEVRRIVEDCTLAVYAFDEAARALSYADPAARSRAVALRSAWTRAMAAAPRPAPTAPTALPSNPSPGPHTPAEPAPPLLEVQRARLRATLLPGLAAPVALARLLLPGERATLCRERRLEGVTIRFLALDLADPVSREAALLLFLEDAGNITGHRLVEGADGTALRGAGGLVRAGPS
jgi:hypothetical protein